MLEYYFRQKRTLLDYRRGPIGPYFDGFAASLHRNGYGQHHAANMLAQCCQFNAYLVDQGIKSCKDIGPTAVESFSALYLKDFKTAHNYSPERSIRNAIKKLFQYLFEIKILQPSVPKPIITTYSWILDHYLRYLLQERQITERTVQAIGDLLSPFLKSLGEKAKPKLFKSLPPKEVEDYVKQHLKTSRDNLRRLAGALRGFLRFSFMKGYTKVDLTGMIPSVPAYRLASLPRGMEDSTLQSILNKINRDTPGGSRDLAIMLIMMGYGIRGIQVAELLLEDINWQRLTITIRARKGGKEVVLPLLESIGEALVGYLRNRPESPLRQVFISYRAPFKSLKGLSISCIVRRYMLAAGIQIPRMGSSTLRHSWAIRALAKDSPIKAIADVLGHRCLDTTFIYAKADLKTLRQVSMSWPEVKP